MSTQWTMTRLVRWRVRDWASCFLATRFPPDDEPDRYYTSTPTEMPVRTMVFTKKSVNSRGEESRKKVSRQRKRESERWRKRSTSPAEEAVVAVENMMTDDDSNWPQFENEDYIVFCFKDGAFDVIKNENSEASSRIDLVSASSRPVSRKLNYGGEDKAKAVKRSNYEEKFNGDTRDIYPANDGDCTVPPQKDEGEEAEAESIYLDTESAMDDSRTTNHREAINDHRIMVPAESSDSNHSDVSNGSFAFPVLGWEWSGSPVQMPKAEGLQLRKHKARCVGFQCCRF